MNAAFFLDRDGVLNRANVRDGKPYAPTRFDQFQLLPRVAEAVETIRRRGYLAIVVTNQPDVGNGMVPRRVVERMHEFIRDSLDVSEIFVCYHSQTAGCECRKPRPGMLVEAASRFGIDLSRSVMVGDRSSDIAAGDAVGCTTVFIDAHYDEAPPKAPNLTASSLFEAVSALEKDDYKVRR